MFEGRAEDVGYPAVLSIRASGVGTVMDEGFHANGDKWVGVVVMVAVHVGVGGDAWICRRLK